MHGWNFFNLAFAAFVLSLPVIITGVLHMYAVTHNWLAVLSIPVSSPVFGANKTWRGFVLMTILSVPGVWLAQALEHCTGGWYPMPLLRDENTVILGAALGLGYTLAELPNSFMKRRLGIRPGGHATRFRHLFVLLDQVDSALGVAASYWLLTDLPNWLLFITIAVFPTITLAVKRVLFLLRLKETYT